jgi:hypothetical protein
MQRNCRANPVGTGKPLGWGLLAFSLVLPAVGCGGAMGDVSGKVTIRASPCPEGW